MSTRSDYPLGPLGLWIGAYDRLPYPALRDAVAEVDERGWPALWIPEAVGRSAFTASALILAATSRITIATGVANIWGRDSTTAAAAHRTLTEAFPERFVLGLGVSHDFLVERVRGHAYRKPLTAMRDYLDAMDRIRYQAPKPSTPLRLVLAALGPKMLELSAERADGAHPYLQTPEHTAIARRHLGPDAVLAPEQMLVLDPGPDSARATARTALAPYLRAPNYANNLVRLGFTDADLADGGSDRLVDAIVVHGDEDRIAARIAEHRDAGADHVCLQPLTTDFGYPAEQIRRLADALLPG